KAAPGAGHGERENEEKAQPRAGTEEGARIVSQDGKGEVEGTGAALESSGFSTGKGRPLCVSEEALRKVEHFFTDAGAGGSSSRREGLGDGKGHSRFVLVPNSREGSLQDQRQGQGQDHGQGGAQGQSKGQGRGLSIRDGSRVNLSGGDGLADKTVLMNSNVQQRSQSFVSRAG
ncbi:unnamed protein product, partial [Discosporangium mesarthrocarpum]